MSQELIQLHNVNPETFKKQIVSEILSRLDKLEDRLPPIQSQWISRKQASNMLGVSLVTISDWTKKGILKPYRIGNRVRFKLSEIDEVLNSNS